MLLAGTMANRGREGQDEEVFDQAVWRTGGVSTGTTGQAAGIEESPRRLASLVTGNDATNKQIASQARALGLAPVSCGGEGGASL